MAAAMYVCMCEFSNMFLHHLDVTLNLQSQYCILCSFFFFYIHYFMWCKVHKNSHLLSINQIIMVPSFLGGPNKKKTCIQKSCRVLTILCDMPGESCRS